MKRFLLPVCLLLLLTACGGPDKDIIKASSVWSRTQPLPTAAEQIETVDLGNMFTREFEVSFSASKESIESWLKDSPGIQDAVVSEARNISTYEVTPGGGAQSAQVTVDWDALIVTIHTYWS